MSFFPGNLTGTRSLRGGILQEGRQGRPDAFTHYSGRGGPYEVLADDEDEYSRYWYYSERSRFRLLVGPQHKDWELQRYLRVAEGPGRTLSHHQRKLLDRKIGEKADILRLLLKPGRHAEEAADHIGGDPGGELGTQVDLLPGRRPLHAVEEVVDDRLHRGEGLGKRYGL